MSHLNKDRKIQSRNGKWNPEQLKLSNALVAQVIAEALRRQFGPTHAAVKLVVGLTKANERAVKNWLNAKNGPDGPHMIALMRGSDEVLEAVLTLAGKRDLLGAKKLLNARDTLERMLIQLDELQR